MSKYQYINYSNSIPIGSTINSASESDSKCNELKVSNNNLKIILNKGKVLTNGVWLDIYETMLDIIYYTI